MNKPLIAVSGGFDPVHIGHIRMISEASRHGNVLVKSKLEDHGLDLQFVVLMDLK